ncbi:hypothetical protein MNB_SUP05-SYMBIONT-5-221 [hydrothermal vent metagenome]|uniref:Uncharacterized protein n=1 Tax=hydrothermal vent metagenome TaxID=652676 RepID=A0A1W1E0F7_9ZZZZ
MIRFVLSIVVVLALIGGAVQFKVTDKDWSLIMNKEIALSSVKTGSVKIYNFVESVFMDVKTSIETVSTPTTK